MYEVLEETVGMTELVEWGLLAPRRFRKLASSHLVCIVTSPAPIMSSEGACEVFSGTACVWLPSFAGAAVSSPISMIGSGSMQRSVRHSKKCSSTLNGCMCGLVFVNKLMRLLYSPIGRFLRRSWGSMIPSHTDHDRHHGCLRYSPLPLALAPNC